MLVSLQFEPECRAIILDGLKKVTVLRDLQASLGDHEASGVDLDFSKLVDIEVRAGAGLFFRLCRKLDVNRFPKTFEFAFTMLENLNAEFERRRAVINEH